MVILSNILFSRIAIKRTYTYYSYNKVAYYYWYIGLSKPIFKMTDSNSTTKATFRPTTIKNSYTFICKGSLVKLWKLKTQGHLSSWEYFKRLQENSISPLIGIPTILQFCLPPEITIWNRILYYIGNSKFISGKNNFKRKMICEIQKAIFSKHKILHLANSRPTKFSNSLFSQIICITLCK